MSVIHKLQLAYTGIIKTELHFPTDAQLLKLYANETGIFCWFKTSGVCETAIPVRFRIYGTGFKIDDQDLQDFEYLDTVYQGALVWHIFIEKNKIKII